MINIVQKINLEKKLEVLFITYYYTPVISENKKEIIGDKALHIKKINNNKTTNAYFSMKFSMKRNLGGNNANKIFDPSSGGIGMRLKIAKTILVKTIVPTIKINELSAKL